MHAHTNDGKTILVFGATGQQGGAVAAHLKKDGWDLSALVRDPDKDNARNLARAGIRLIRGDLNDEESIRRAMQNVHGVFSVQPSSGQGAVYNVTDEDEVRYGQAVARIAMESGVQHLVYSSANAVGETKTGMGHFDSKAEIETYIRSLDLSATIVRPATFMELLMLPGMGLEKGNFTFFLRPGMVAQFTAVSDIGSVVASIFASHNRFAGRTIEIASDQLSGNQIAAKLSEAAGKPISYRRFPQRLLDDRPFLSKLAGLFDSGRLAGNADLNAIRLEFGSLTTFDEWLASSGKSRLVTAMEATEANIALR